MEKLFFPQISQNLEIQALIMYAKSKVCYAEKIFKKYW